MNTGDPQNDCLSIMEICQNMHHENMAILNDER